MEDISGLTKKKYLYRDVVLERLWELFTEGCDSAQGIMVESAYARAHAEVKSLFSISGHEIHDQIQHYGYMLDTHECPYCKRAFSVQKDTPCVKCPYDDCPAAIEASKRGREELANEVIDKIQESMDRGFGRVGWGAINVDEIEKIRKEYEVKT